MDLMDYADCRILLLGLVLTATPARADDPASAHSSAGYDRAGASAGQHQDEAQPSMRMMPIAAEAIDCKRPTVQMANRRSGDRILTSDGKTWLLHDVVAKRVLASGPLLQYGQERSTDLAGDRFTVYLRDSAELRDARDGRLIKLFGGSGANNIRVSRAGMAVDGSYAWMLSYASVTVIQASGEERRLDLGMADDGIFAAARQVQTIRRPDDLAYVQLVNIADGSKRSSPPTRTTYRWSDDGLHYLNDTVLGGLKVFDLSFNEVLSLQFPYGQFEINNGFGEFYWGSSRGERRVDFFRLGTPLGAGGLPVPIASIPVLDWGLPPRDNLRAHRTVRSERGSVAVFGVDRTYFWLADVRGSAPVLTQVSVPEPVRPDSFASDSNGRWSLIAESGRLYASEEGAVDRARLIGCSMP